MSRYRESRTYFGSVLGAINAWYTGSSPPYFNIRAIGSDSLVKCFYRPADHDTVHRLLKRRNAKVYVGGFVTFNMLTRRVEEVSAERFLEADTSDGIDPTALFGSVPNLTGELSPEDFSRDYRMEKR